MEKMRLALLMLLSGAFIFCFQACTDAGTGNDGNTGGGNQVTDTTVQPQPASGGGTRDYSSTTNLVDPNHYEFFRTYAFDKGMAFNEEFIAVNGISEITTHVYGDAENPDLEEDMRETDGRLSSTVVYQFDDRGELTNFQHQTFMNGNVQTEKTFTPEFNAVGMVEKIQARDVAFDDTKEYEINIEYMGEFPTAIENPEGISIYMTLDPATKRMYEMTVAPSGNTVVKVHGKPGDFPDETCKEIQTEILMRASKFVPYAKAGNSLKNVIFYEEEDRRKIVRHVIMGVAGEIDAYVVHEDNDFGNRVDIKFNWEDKDALFQSWKRFKYSPTNDLVKVINQGVRQNDGSTTKTDKFDFNAEGFLQKHVYIRVEGSQTPQVQSVEFYSYKLENKSGETVDGSPTGTGGN